MSIKNLLNRKITQRFENVETESQLNENHNMVIEEYNNIKKDYSEMFSFSKDYMKSLLYHIVILKKLNTIIELLYISDINDVEDILYNNMEDFYNFLEEIQIKPEFKSEDNYIDEFKNELNDLLDIKPNLTDEEIYSEIFHHFKKTKNVILEYIKDLQEDYNQIHDLLAGTMVSEKSLYDSIFEVLEDFGDINIPLYYLTQNGDIDPVEITHNKYDFRLVEENKAYKYNDNYFLFNGVSFNKFENIDEIPDGTLCYRNGEQFNINDGLLFKIELSEETLENENLYEFQDTIYRLSDKKLENISHKRVEHSDKNYFKINQTAYKADEINEIPYLNEVSEVKDVSKENIFFEGDTPKVLREETIRNGDMSEIVLSKRIVSASRYTELIDNTKYILLDNWSYYLVTFTNNNFEIDRKLSTRDSSLYILTDLYPRTFSGNLFRFNNSFFRCSDKELYSIDVTLENESVIKHNNMYYVYKNTEDTLNKINMIPLDTNEKFVYKNSNGFFKECQLIGTSVSKKSDIVSINLTTVYKIETNNVVLSGSGKEFILYTEGFHIDDEKYYISNDRIFKIDTDVFTYKHTIADTISDGLILTQLVDFKKLALDSLSLSGKSQLLYYFLEIIKLEEIKEFYNNVFNKMMCSGFLEKYLSFYLKDYYFKIKEYEKEFKEHGVVYEDIQFSYISPTVSDKYGLKSHKISHDNIGEVIRSYKTQIFHNILKISEFERKPYIKSLYKDLLNNNKTLSDLILILTINDMDLIEKTLDNKKINSLIERYLSENIPFTFENLINI